ncbi:hypothetical protein [Cytophaga aurantiaca]|uniref:hypothetical protein n=1 Tax=Cytophaga aurantiaca TaxID=29530 RepID=UPI0003815F73|nr:hypothetical protein [Cytophaga aurantiaca]
MIKVLIIPTILFVLFSCETDFSAKSDQIKTTSSKQDSAIKKTNSIQDTTLIKDWLTKVIIDYVNSEDGKVAYNNMRLALTDKYYNYKQNAINLEYGEEMTEEEFHEKWKSIYDTKFVGKGGFFIPTQDNGTIDIPTCTLLKSLGDTAQIFHVVIRDLRWKTNFVRDITIISKDNKLLIDDVKEYE